jgi:membrane-bound serine protease (ClpP class)
MLFESPVPYLRASLSVIIPTVAVTAAFFIFALTMAIKAQMAKPATGSEGLVDEMGIARTRIDPEGQVFVHGEWWNAYSDEIIEAGEKIRVLKTDRLKLKVEKLRK